MSPLARRRDGRNTTRAVKNLMPTSRRRRVSGAGLSGAAADRLLDGGDDGPLPLRQLLAAATAPATAAELQGEASACAVFRSSVHSAEAPLGRPRRARAKTATAIVTSKIIAALVLTAGTAGGVALATHSYSTNVQQQSSTVGGTDTSTARVDGAARSDGSSGVGGSDDADTGGAGPAKAHEASSTVTTGRCRPACPTTTKGSVTPPGQRDRHTGNPHAGNGARPGNGNAGEEKGNGAGNGNGAGKEKNADKGNAVGKEKNADKSNGAGKEKNAEKQDNASGDGQSGAGSRQAGDEKGSGKKKADAGTTT